MLFYTSKFGYYNNIPLQMDNFIIVIGRQFGCGGREIGQKIAEALGVPYYDKTLLSKAADEFGMDPEIFQAADESTSIPKTAAGSALPKYCMYLGVGLREEKTIKGRNLVVIVPKAQRAIVIICWATVIYESCLSILLRKTVSSNTMLIIAGIRKESAPKIIRQTTEAAVPMTAV